MRKILLMMAFLLPLTFAFTGCSDDDEKVAENLYGCWKIWFNPFSESYVELEEDGTYEFVYSRLKSAGGNEMITWNEYMTGAWDLQNSQLQLQFGYGLDPVIISVLKVSGDKASFGMEQEGIEIAGGCSAERVVPFSSDKLGGGWSVSPDRVFGWTDNSLEFRNNGTYGWSFVSAGKANNVEGEYTIVGNAVVLLNWDPDIFFVINKDNGDRLSFSATLGKKWYGDFELVKN